MSFGSFILNVLKKARWFLYVALFLVVAWFGYGLIVRANYSSICGPFEVKSEIKGYHIGFDKTKCNSLLKKIKSRSYFKGIENTKLKYQFEIKEGGNFSGAVDGKGVWNVKYRTLGLNNLIEVSISKDYFLSAGREDLEKLINALVYRGVYEFKYRDESSIEADDLKADYQYARNFGVRYLRLLDLGGLFNGKVRAACVGHGTCPNPNGGGVWGSWGSCTGYDAGQCWWDAGWDDCVNLSACSSCDNCAWVTDTPVPPSPTPTCPANCSANRCNYNSQTCYTDTTLPVNGTYPNCCNYSNDCRDGHNEDCVPTNTPVPPTATQTPTNTPTPVVMSCSGGAVLVTPGKVPGTVGEGTFYGRGTVGAGTTSAKVYKYSADGSFPGYSSCGADGDASCGLIVVRPSPGYKLYFATVAKKTINGTEYSCRPNNSWSPGPPNSNPSTGCTNNCLTFVNVITPSPTNTPTPTNTPSPTPTCPLPAAPVFSAYTNVGNSSNVAGRCGQPVVRCTNVVGGPTWNWTNPNGGLPSYCAITSTKVFKNGTWSGPTPAPPAITSYGVSNLTDHQCYAVTARYSNVKGDGPWMMPVEWVEVDRSAPMPAWANFSCSYNNGPVGSEVFSATFGFGAVTDNGCAGMKPAPYHTEIAWEAGFPGGSTLTWDDAFTSHSVTNNAGTTIYGRVETSDNFDNVSGYKYANPIVLNCTNCTGCPGAPPATQTPTFTPTITPTDEPTPPLIPTDTPTPTVTAAPTGPTPTGPTATPTPTGPTNTPINSPTPTNALTPVPTSTPTPTGPTNTPINSPTPTNALTPVPTSTPTPEPGCSVWEPQPTITLNCSDRLNPIVEIVGSSGRNFMRSPNQGTGWGSVDAGVVRSFYYGVTDGVGETSFYKTSWYSGMASPIWTDTSLNPTPYYVNGQQVGELYPPSTYWGNLDFASHLVSGDSLVAGQTYYYRAKTDGGIACASSEVAVNFNCPNTNPMFQSFVIQNSGGAVVDAEVGDRNHICQPEFSPSGAMSGSDGRDRKAAFVLNVADEQGANTINRVEVSSGSNFGLVWTRSGGFSLTPAGGSLDYYEAGSVTEDSNLMELRFPVHFSENFANDSVAALSIRVVDADGNELSYPVGRSFRVWNCRVGGGGRVFDNSGQILACPSSGFTNPVPESAGFSSLIFDPIFDGFNDEGNVLTTISNFSDYSVSGSWLWGLTYDPLMVINSSTPQMRINQTVCNLAQLRVDSAVADPYTAGGTLTADFSVLLAQGAWYQAVGGGLAGGARVRNDIPVTCPLDLSCKAAFSVGAGGEANNGLVAAEQIVNNSGCDFDTCKYGSPNNWHFDGNVVEGKTDYSYFKTQFFERLGVGKTYFGNTDLSTIVGEGTKMALVNGNLTVSADNTVAQGDLLMVVVSGSVSIGQGVKRMDGVLVADGEVVISGSSSDQLVINGILYSTNSNVRIQRSYIDTMQNNISPAVVINYRPDFAFTMPAAVYRVISGWKEGR